MTMAEENPSEAARANIEAGSGPPPSRGTKSGARPPSGYSRSKSRRKTLIGIAVLVLVVCGVFLWRYLSSYESTDDAQVDVHLYPVSARVSGYVVRVNVDDNQWVQKGTVLVEIDPTDYEVAVAQAKANLSNAKNTAQSLHITVPITSVNTSSQLQFNAS